MRWALIWPLGGAGMSMSHILSESIRYSRDCLTRMRRDMRHPRRRRRMSSIHFRALALMALMRYRSLELTSIKSTSTILRILTTQHNLHRAQVEQKISKNYQKTKSTKVSSLLPKKRTHKMKWPLSLRVLKLFKLMKEFQISSRILVQRNFNRYFSSLKSFSSSSQISRIKHHLRRNSRQSKPNRASKHLLIGNHQEKNRLRQDAVPHHSASIKKI